MKPYLSAIVIKLLDIATTAYIVQSKGSFSEKNPFMRLCIDTIGLAPALFLSLLITIAAITILYKKGKIKALILICIFLGIVVVGNIIHMLNILGLV